jgi:hypothetical protein
MTAPAFNYTDDEIRNRVHSGGDANRAKTIDQWVAAAKGGDQAALQQLIRMGDFDGPGGDGWATPDARNYDRMALRDLGIDTGGYMKQGDGGGFMHSLGGVLKVAAPLAGALIPGVGMVGAGLIGGLGSAAGGVMQGDKFNALKTLAAGGAAAVGNKLLGNGLGSGSTNWGFGSTPPRELTPGAPGGTTPGSGGTGSSGQPGALSRFGDIGSLIQKYGPLALGAAGMIDQAGQDNHASQLRDQALKMSLDDWNSRAPLRQQAMSRMLAPAAPRANLGASYSDPTDPYRRK